MDWLYCTFHVNDITLCMVFVKTGNILEVYWFCTINRHFIYLISKGYSIAWILHILCIWVTWFTLELFPCCCDYLLISFCVDSCFHFSSVCRHLGVELLLGGNYVHHFKEPPDCLPTLIPISHVCGFRLPHILSTTCLSSQPS